MPYWLRLERQHQYRWPAGPRWLWMHYMRCQPDIDLWRYKTSSYTLFVPPLNKSINVVTGSGSGYTQVCPKLLFVLYVNLCYRVDRPGYQGVPNSAIGQSPFLQFLWYEGHPISNTHCGRQQNRASCYHHLGQWFDPTIFPDHTKRFTCSDSTVLRKY